MESGENTKANILLVEDTLTQALLMQHQLKKVGYTVKLARNAKAALDEIEKDANYDIILSDINMPGMDGFQLCKELKQKDASKNIPFILLATPVEKGEILKMLDCGAENFILKAYDESSFLAKLAEILQTMQLRKAGSSKTVYAGEEVELSSTPPALADFLLSAYEMYVYQLSKSAAQNEAAQ